MKRTFPVFLLICVFTVAASAQPPDSLWAYSYGGDMSEFCWSVQPAADGGYLMAGWTESYGAGDRDFWLLKTNADGDSLWSHAYGSEENDMGFAMCPTADGNFMLAGVSGAAGSPDFWIIKVDPDGTPLWDRRYGGAEDDRCWSVQQTADGGYILAGWTRSFGAGNLDGWLLKTDSNGDSLWSTSFGGTEDDYLFSVKQTNDGGYILAGFTVSFSVGEDDFWLIKTDAGGDSLWSQTFGGLEHDEARTAMQTADGGYLIAGWGTFDDDNRDFMLVKTGANGDSLWGRTYGGSGLEHCNALLPVMGGGYVLAGRSTSYTNGSDDSWLLRIDEAGDSLWSTHFGSTDWNICTSIIQISDKSFVMGGGLITAESGYEFQLLKTTPDPLPAANFRSPLPQTFALSVYPNPFNPLTTIAFDLPREMNVRLSVFDITGRLMTTLADERFAAGTHAVQFDGSAYPSGIYFARLQADNYQQTEKMILLK